MIPLFPPILGLFTGAKTVVTAGDPVVLLDAQSAGLLATMREAIYGGSTRSNVKFAKRP